MLVARINFVLYYRIRIIVKFVREGRLSHLFERCVGQLIGQAVFPAFKTCISLPTYTPEAVMVVFLFLGVENDSCRFIQEMNKQNKMGPASRDQSRRPWQSLLSLSSGCSCLLVHYIFCSNDSVY